MKPTRIFNGEINPKTGLPYGVNLITRKQINPSYRVSYATVDLGYYATVEDAVRVRIWMEKNCAYISDKKQIKQIYKDAVADGLLPNGLNLRRFPSLSTGMEVPYGVCYYPNKNRWRVLFGGLDLYYKEFEDAKRMRLWLEHNARFKKGMALIGALTEAIAQGLPKPTNKKTYKLRKVDNSKRKPRVRSVSDESNSLDKETV